jgi:hypothetical protein
MRDKRKRPQKKTHGIVLGVLVMALTRLGSLNGLEQIVRMRFLKRLINEEPASADTVGRVMSLLNNDDLREINRHIYSRMKRNKALKPMVENMSVLIIDGHETTASYHRRCDECLERKTETKDGEKTQYYHRNVCGMLKCRDFSILLDVEEQRRGEDEVAAATRLLARIMKNYPRAFKIIIADGLYARASFFELALSYKKEVIAVLKDERRELLQDAMGMFKGHSPCHVYEDKRKIIKCWDMEDFDSWDTFGGKVRVVRTVEETTITRQNDKKDEVIIREWFWVSTITKEKIGTEDFVNLAHGRWAIENNGFNEFVTYWQADHVYKHNVDAINAFWLMTILACNLFHAFIRLNLKPQLRERHTKLYFLLMITAELFNGQECEINPATG